MTWLRACTVDDLEDGDAFQVEIDPPIAVFNVDGHYFAIDDTCTHDKSSLADGYVDGGQVECSWHFAKFCIKTGAALTPPATVAVSTYDVRIDGDDVMVHVDR
ncbi:bifunctional 3-phenylpropionate/cinnamic acid dioxygenase ferredoxin subunit [Sphaerisporangium sp. NPDC051011]|uniref:bifunctional 3-phenylpropionate/cinnamic acid dioxygenase ferredoxin subunit n=1 Tax=Sphaerisporangium sp. NPDC051011 TaxID=3155792 RepID=UPI0033FAC7AC